jgi:hypothetical protein
VLRDVLDDRNRSVRVAYIFTLNVIYMMLLILPCITTPVYHPSLSKNIRSLEHTKTHGLTSTVGRNSISQEVAQVLS